MFNDGQIYSNRLHAHVVSFAYVTHIYLTDEWQTIIKQVIKSSCGHRWRKGVSKTDYRVHLIPIIHNNAHTKKRNWPKAMAHSFRWPFDLTSNYLQIKRLHVWITQMESQLNSHFTQLCIRTPVPFCQQAKKKNCRLLWWRALVYLRQEHCSIKIKLCNGNTEQKSGRIHYMFVPNNCAHTIAATIDYLSVERQPPWFRPSS